MELSNNIIEILDYLGKKLGVAVDFSNQNIVPYLQQLAEKYINYKISTCIFWIVICTLGIIAGIVAIIVETKFLYWDMGLVGVGGILAIGVGIIFICINAYDIVVCKTFPEKAIFDYLMTLKNSM